MIRKIAVAATAGALALGGLAAFGAGTAGAVTQVTAGAGSSITCTTIKAKATLSPALKDNWVKADHATDPDLAFRNIPDTTFASIGPVAVGATTKASTCSGTITGPGAPAGGILVKKATLTLSGDPAFPGLSNPATCKALTHPAPPAPTDAKYKVTVAWSSGTKGFTIAPTTATGVGLQNAGVGFAIGGGTITGSFAGGSSTTQANVDAKTLGYFLTSAGFATYDSTTAKVKHQCQAQAKSKKGVWSLKAPKGIAKIGVASGSVHFQR